MKLDREFVRELKKYANGDGSREARFAFLKHARETAKRLSTTSVMREIDEIIQEQGRLTVALCFAVTILRRRDRLEPQTVRWAEEVLKLWTNRPPRDLSLYIDDGLHPTSIEVYAGELIKCTME